MIDLHNFCAEKKAAMRIALEDEDAEIGPVPTTGGGHGPEPELDRLSNILKAFNEQYGTLFTDADRVMQRISNDIAPKVAADPAYRNAIANSDRQNARVEMDTALWKVMVDLMKDDTELFKQFSDNESFRRGLMDAVFALTYASAP
jgi:type I restriction enzyme R subunit